MARRRLSDSILWLDVLHLQGYSILPCQPFDLNNPPMGPVLWFFYMSKILDFLDTVFIILGKKWNQLSFLHVYHHVTIFLVRHASGQQNPADIESERIWRKEIRDSDSETSRADCLPLQVYWLNLNAGYDGDIFLTVILNGAIHTVMYTYYFLSMHTKDIWWKKYLTLMQIVQFLAMNGQVR